MEPMASAMASMREIFQVLMEHRETYTPREVGAFGELSAAQLETMNEWEMTWREVAADPIGYSLMLAMKDFGQKAFDACGDIRRMRLVANALANDHPGDEEYAATLIELAWHGISNRGVTWTSDGGHGIL